MRSKVITGLLLTLLVLFNSCTAKKETPVKPDVEPTVQLTIGHVGHDHQIALGVAALRPEATAKACGVHLKEQKAREVYDLYKGDKALARLIIKKVGGGSKMPAAMAKGALDIGFGGIPAVIKFIDKGNNFKILCPLNVDGDMLLIRPSYKAKNWEEFVALANSMERPLDIGVKNIKSVAKLICHQACIDAGIGDKVNFIDLKGNKNIIPNLLAPNSVDAVATNEPVCSKAIVKGAARKISLLADLPPKGKFHSHPCCCICTTSKTIKEHPAILQAFITLMKCGNDMINADKKKAASDGAKWTKIDEKVEQLSIPNIVYKIVPDESYRNGLNQWFLGMKTLKFLNEDLADRTFEELYKEVHDFSFIEKVGKQE